MEKSSEGINHHVEEASKSLHSNISELSILGLHSMEFVLQMDWSEGYVGYMLFTIFSNGQKCPVDIGNKTNEYGSAHLGELKGIILGMS